MEGSLAGVEKPFESAIGYMRSYTTSCMEVIRTDDNMDGSMVGGRICTIGTVGRTSTGSRMVGVPTMVKKGVGNMSSLLDWGAKRIEFMPSQLSAVAHLVPVEQIPHAKVVDIMTTKKAVHTIWITTS